MISLYPAKNYDIYTSESSNSIKEAISDDMSSSQTYNDSYTGIENSEEIVAYDEPESFDDKIITKKEQNDKVKTDESESSANHYGYWLNSIDMLNINLTDMSEHGVTDLFLNFYAYTRYNQSIVESFIVNATDKNIKVHIWAQIFYDGGWVKPIINGTVNQEFFDKKIEELKQYANTPGVAGIHFDYLRFSGSAYYNNSAEQHPGGIEAITEFVNQATTAIREINPNLNISAALMPEIEHLKTWYGDDYEALSERLDAVLPMIYVANFRQNATCVKETTQWFTDNSKGAEVWTGLQGYTVNDPYERYISPSPQSQISIEIKSAQEGGSKGALIFRYGITEDIDFINLPIDENEFYTFNNFDYEILCSRNYATLDHDFTFNSTHDTNYVNGIGIHRNNLIIDGNNHVINGSSLARMFNVTGKNITFQNIVFVNGNSDNGGVLYIIGENVSIINCTFIDSDATIEGGAVFISAANATIINSKFINNTAIYNVAVYINSINATVRDSYFENNVANISAGAIGWVRKENGLIDNCTFINNSAHNEVGGGVVFWNQGANGTITNSKFENNYANYNGSTISWSYGQNGTISNCIFTDNNASVAGGAIIIKGENITVDKCEFNNNTATMGGAIYSTMGNFDVINSYFENNQASHVAALYNEAEVTLNADTFIGNSEETDNFIYTFKNMTITDSTINTDNLERLICV